MGSAPNPQPIALRPVTTQADAAAFLALPARLAGLGWSVPLRMEQAWLFDARRNGFLDANRVTRFLAWREGAVVGRIAACLPEDLAAPATFGFLCCIEDPSVLGALLGAARGWIGAAGRGEMLGPLSFSINHEVGALVAGFDRPPMLHMPRTPPWLPAMLDAEGLTAVQDVLACTLDLAAERHRARFAALCAARPAEAARLRLHGLDRRDFAAGMREIRARYNAAWAANWGALPLGAREVESLGELLRPLLWRGEVLFADWEGAPAGLLSIVPNIEPALPAYGRMTPGAALRLGLALGAPPGLGGARSARIPMLGLMPAFRGTPAGAMVLGGMLARALDLAATRGWGQVEISWILQHNAAMLNAMARLPAPVTGRWRLWRGDATGTDLRGSR